MSTATQAVSIGSTAATSIATAIAAHSTTAAAAVGAAAGATAGTAPASSVWVPIIGPAIAAVTVVLMLWLNRRGPAQKTATTAAVNELEPILKENLKAYMEGPRTKASQAAALKNFDDAWIWLTGPEACGSPDMGAPGRACIADRSPGGRWPWAAYYRDPIANDAAQDDIFGVPLSSFTTSPEGKNGLLLAGALIVAALAL